MEIEYRQWQFIKNHLYPFIKEKLSLDDKWKRYEGKNVINAWLMEANQLDNIDKYEYYPLLPKILILERKPLGRITENFVKDIEKKQFFEDDDERPTLAVRDILRYIEDSHDVYDREPLNLDPVIENGKISVGEFKDKSFLNLPFLLNKKQCDRWNERDIMNVFLRYESVGNRGYQWNLPREVHKCYYNSYNVKYEGFASPLSSTFLTLPEGQFCSLFLDTDRIFGSMGDFFQIDLSKYPGGWSVNPPFIEDIIRKVTDKVINVLDSGVETTFFCTFPWWVDNEAWIRMSQSRYNIKSYHQKLVLQKVSGKYINPNVKMSVFCLSFSKDINLDELDLLLTRDKDYYQNLKE